MNEHTGKPAQMATTTPDTASAPLTAYQIIDVVEKWEGSHGYRFPAGACWQCGQAIAYCVQIRHAVTGEQHEIGTTCAERFGLDSEQLERMLAEKYAEDRAQLAELRRQANKEAAALADATAAAQHGPHGTLTRFTSGCICEDCKAAAPHGIALQARQYRVSTRFYAGCRCLECIDAAITLDVEHRFRNGHRIVENLTVIIELATGQPVKAKRVDTRYGRRWCVRDGQVWLPVTPQRRQTQAKHGFVEATAPWLVAGRTAIIALGCPITDAWGEPIPRPRQT